MAPAPSKQSLATVRDRVSFNQTVPRELAHRRALGEVFIADSIELEEDEFALAMQVPRSHSLWFDRQAPYHDPLATLEASRQGTFVIVHRYLGIERGPPFTLHRIGFRVLDLEAYRDDESSPFEAIWHARLEDTNVRAGVLVGMRLRGTLLVDGSPAATLEGEVAMLPQREYEMVRATQRARVPVGSAARPLGARIDPALVGRIDRRNVVIGLLAPGEGEEASYPLVVDERHPSFYDHPQDHVPGPLIVEAYRQAAIVTACRSGALASPVAAVSGCEATFGDFCEPDAPASCSASVAGVDGARVEVEVGLHQFGARIASARIELTPYP